jgi:indole-3-glycerol phosphate synthase
VIEAMLEEILHNKRLELSELRRERLPAPPELRTVQLRRTSGQPLKVIAEIKRRSPSAGPLSRVLGIGERARAYERGGAHMISVLCDAKYFDGAYAHLGQARLATSLPILCKEFILDEVQLDAARAHGADAVLLIVRCVSATRLRELLQAAAERGLAALTEVYTPREVPVALDAGAELIGVNARDLGSLVMDASRAHEILSALPDWVARVHLSGIRSEEQLLEVARSRADAALIGECLMREDDPTALLERLVRAGASA